MFGPPSLKNQELLILDTREKIQPYMKAAAAIPGLEWDETELIQTVFQCIQYEGTALSQLHDKCLQLIASACGMSLSERLTSAQGWRRVALNPYDQLETSFRHVREVWQAENPTSNTPWLNETVQVANILSELGMYLYTTLRSLGCYTNGYLFYQFKDWVGYDMLLVRFEPDLESLR